MNYESTELHAAVIMYIFHVLAMFLAIIASMVSVVYKQ